MKFGAWLILFFSVVTFCLAGYKTFLSITHPVKYKDEIIEFCNALNLNPAIVASVINVESSYDKNAVSNKNAIGLMQIKLSTAEYVSNIYKLEKVNKQKLFEPKTNIKFGCYYLKYLSEKFDNIYTILASYNAGETRVRTWLSNENYSKDKKTLINIPYEETENYIKKLKNNINFYKKAYKL